MLTADCHFRLIIHMMRDLCDVHQKRSQESHKSVEEDMDE